MTTVVGIDLGTSNTCVAVMKDGVPRVIIDRRGRSVTPSAITIDKQGNLVIGHKAKSQQITNPYGTIYSLKRLLGQPFQSSQVQSAIQRITFDIEEGPQGEVIASLGEHKMTPLEGSTKILEKVKKIAESALNEELSEAVITVPAHFNNEQRKQTKQAAEDAGFEVLRLINEPTSAALAYGYGQKSIRNIAVYDFGGGTFDVSIMEVGDDIYEVIATGGDSFLGGDDINARIADYVVGKFFEETEIDLHHNKMAMQRIYDAAENAKIQLSDVENFPINLPRIAPEIDFHAHLKIDLTKEIIEELCSDLIEQTLRICTDTLSEARIDLPDIDEVILVGGQTRMPMVRSRVSQFFGKEALDNVNPDEVVAVGASIQASTLVSSDEDVLLLDVAPLSLGIESMSNLFAPVIKKNTKVPHRVTKIFTTSADYQENVRISIYQGEDRKTVGNSFLGEFILSGIRKAKRMIPRIEVTFRIDANGILHVSARDQTTSKEQSIKINDLAKRVVDDIMKSDDNMMMDIEIE